MRAKHTGVQSLGSSLKGLWIFCKVSAWVLYSAWLGTVQPWESNSDFKGSMLPCCTHVYSQPQAHTARRQEPSQQQKETSTIVKTSEFCFLHAIFVWFLHLPQCVIYDTRRYVIVAKNKSPTRSQYACRRRQITSLVIMSKKKKNKTTNVFHMEKKSRRWYNFVPSFDSCDTGSTRQPAGILQWLTTDYFVK